MVNEITFEVSGQSVQMDVDDALSFVGIAVHVGSNGYARVDRKDWIGDRYVHRFIMDAKKGGHSENRVELKRIVHE